MAPHYSTLAWKIPWMEEPGRLQTMGSQSQKRLSNFTFTFHFHALEKEMATHSSIFAWQLPWTEQLDRLQSRRSQRVSRTERVRTHTHKHTISLGLSRDKKNITLPWFLLCITSIVKLAKTNKMTPYNTQEEGKW